MGQKPQKIGHFRGKVLGIMELVLVVHVYAYIYINFVHFENFQMCIIIPHFDDAL